MEKKYNILVADDDPCTVKIVSMILQNAGYEVTEDPKAEMNFLSTGINPDLVLLDNQLGEKRGSSLCLDLKQNEKTKNISIILVSGIDELKALAKQVYADDFLNKPFSITSLLQKVESLLLKKPVPC